MAGSNENNKDLIAIFLSDSCFRAYFKVKKFAGKVDMDQASIRILKRIAR